MDHHSRGTDLAAQKSSGITVGRRWTIACGLEKLDWDAVAVSQPGSQLRATDRSRSTFRQSIIEEVKLLDRALGE